MHPYLGLVKLAKEGLRWKDYRPDGPESVGTKVGRWFKKQIYKNEFAGASDGYINDEFLGWAVLTGILYNWMNEEDIEKGLKEYFIDGFITFSLKKFTYDLQSLRFSDSAKLIYYTAETMIDQADYRIEILKDVQKVFYKKINEVKIDGVFCNIIPEYNTLELSSRRIDGCNIATQFAVSSFSKVIFGRSYIDPHVIIYMEEVIDKYKICYKYPMFVQYMRNNWG